MGSPLDPVYAALDLLLPFAFAEPAFMKRALLAVLLVAPAAAAVGVPLVHHRMAFFSDAVGHSAFTGVALGVLLGVDPLYTMVAFGIVVAWGITAVRGRTELSPDTVIGVFFSTAVALGIAVISARKGLARHLQAFLYGDVLAVSETEILGMALLLVGTAAYLAVTYNRILLAGVHEGLARTMGIPLPVLQASFAVVVALVVTTAIRTVGILLVTALLVVPAAAARNVARSAAGAFWIAVGVAVASGVAGVAASFYLETAAGASVVLAASAAFAASAVLKVARQRG